MDLKDPKVQKSMLGILAVFLILYFWYARIFSGYAEKIHQNEIKYERILTELKDVEMKAKSIDNLKREYEELLNRYKTVELLLPEEKQTPLFLNQMHSAAQVAQAKITEIVPKETKPISFYNASGFAVQLTGAYHQLGTFFSNVANFPFLSNISEVSITAVPGEAKGEKKDKNTISASFKLTTFYIREEEKIKKLEF